MRNGAGWLTAAGQSFSKPRRGVVNEVGRGIRVAGCRRRTFLLCDSSGGVDGCAMVSDELEADVQDATRAPEALIDGGDYGEIIEHRRRVLSPDRQRVQWRGRERGWRR